MDDGGGGGGSVLGGRGGRWSVGYAVELVGVWVSVVLVVIHIHPCTGWRSCRGDSDKDDT